MNKICRWRQKTNRNIRIAEPIFNPTSSYFQKKYLERLYCVSEPLIPAPDYHEQLFYKKIHGNARCKSKYAVRSDSEFFFVTKILTYIYDLLSNLIEKRINVMKVIVRITEYTTKNLHQGFGQLKDVQHEKREIGKPTMVIHSPEFDINENSIVVLTNHILKELEKKELRKRFNIAHTEKYIYIIGGYIYDYQNSVRKNPKHDYKYDLKTHKFIPVEAIPNSAIGFGLCMDENYVYAVGGHTINNLPLKDCYRLNIREENESWTKLPSLPAPTNGPGLGVYQGELHCVGGYDVLGNKSIAHGEYLILRYPNDQQWRYAPEIGVPRARPLVFILANNSRNGETVYVAGGFNVSSKNNKPFIVADLQLFNQKEQTWKHLTTIPQLELSHALSFSDDKLNISETIESADKPPITRIVRSFDLQRRIWIDGKSDINKSGTSKTLPYYTPPNTLSEMNRRSNKTSPDQIIQTQTSNLSDNTKNVTLKTSANRKIEQNNMKSNIDRSRPNSAMTDKNRINLKAHPIKSMAQTKQNSKSKPIER